MHRRVLPPDPPEGKSPSRRRPHLQPNAIKHKRTLQKYTCAEARSHFLFVWLPTIVHPAAPKKKKSERKVVSQKYVLIFFALRNTHIVNNKNTLIMLKKWKSNTQSYWQLHLIMFFSFTIMEKRLGIHTFKWELWLWHSVWPATNSPAFILTQNDQINK